MRPLVKWLLSMPKFDWCYMQRDAVCLTACFKNKFNHWILEITGLLFYIYGQIRISDMCQILICLKTTMMMKCKHHESHITFGIAPTGQTQNWEHTSVQAH